jgi:hypothetical protein
MSDKIIQEVWQIKDTIGKEVNYNIHSLGVLLQRRQHAGSKKVVDLSRLRKKKTAKENPPAPVQ